MCFKNNNNNLALLPLISYDIRGIYCNHFEKDSLHLTQLYVFLPCFMPGGLHSHWQRRELDQLCRNRDVGLPWPVAALVDYNGRYMCDSHVAPPVCPLYFSS